MTQSFVRLAILHEGERCAEGCRYLGVRPAGSMRYSCDLFTQASVEPLRHPECIAATAQQALDDAVLGAADRFADALQPDIRELTDRLDEAVYARRSATREGRT